MAELRPLDGSIMHRLRRLRLEAALTQQDLARVSGVSVGTIIRLERGGPAPYPSTVRKLAGALGVRPQALTRCGPPETDAPTSPPDPAPGAGSEPA